MQALGRSGGPLLALVKAVTYPTLGRQSGGRLLFAIRPTSSRKAVTASSVPQIRTDRAARCAVPNRGGTQRQEKRRQFAKNVETPGSPLFYIRVVSASVLPVTAQRHTARVSRALHWMEERLEEPVSLASIAAVADLSPYHFHRVFRAVVGESPKAHLRRLRLERAVYRLKVSTDTVLHIALESGFATPETFTRAFSRSFEISPSEYRRMLRSYREYADVDQPIKTFEGGFTDETPLTLRFDLDAAPVWVERTPERHLLVVRHTGYVGLGIGYSSIEPWKKVRAIAEVSGIAHLSDRLVGITRDDPYVVDDEQVRFDAALQIDAPIDPPYPFTYRWMPAQLCVAHRHTGGAEEIAKTFAAIGVQWMPSDGWRLRCASPFQIHHLNHTTSGAVRISHTDAYVPLDRQPGEAP